MKKPSIRFYAPLEYNRFWLQKQLPDGSVDYVSPLVVHSQSTQYLPEILTDSYQLHALGNELFLGSADLVKWVMDAAYTCLADGIRLGRSNKPIKRSTLDQ